MHDPLLATYAQVTQFRKEHVLQSQVSMEKCYILIRKEGKYDLRIIFFPNDVNLVSYHKFLLKIQYFDQ